MNEREFAIGIIYSKGAFEVEELDDLKEELKIHRVSLLIHEKSSIINAALDFFVPAVEILLSPDIVTPLIQGVLPNAVWDAIKYTVNRLYQKFHNRPIAKIQGGKVTEETANIRFSIGNNHMILPVDIEREKYQYAVDKFIEFAAKAMPVESTYVWYSENDNTLCIKTERQIIEEEVENHRTNEQR